MSPTMMTPPPISRLKLAFLFLLSYISASRTVPILPTKGTSGIVALSNSIGETNFGDDLNKHTLDKLSSAATCLVSDIEYTHGQQIFRKDKCEFCLCLDGEMFCWWQECPPASKSQYSTNQQSSSQIDDSGTYFEDLKTTSKTTDTPENQRPTNEDVTLMGKIITRTLFSTTTRTPQICYVMGQQYRVGEKLPHNTGNCVECVCGTNAQISCSPHQCASSSVYADDIAEFRQTGLRSPQVVF